MASRGRARVRDGIGAAAGSPRGGPRAALLPLILLVGLVACSSPPPARVATPFGDARAATHDEAEELAELLRSSVPVLRETLPGALQRDTDVWLEEFDRYDALRRRPSVVGLASPGSGLVRIRADRLGRDADFVLAHELVHAMLGPDWDPLPSVVTEGLCDALAARLAPESAAVIRAARRLDAAFGWPRLELELRVFDASDTLRTVVPVPLGDPRGEAPFELLELPGRGLHLREVRGDEPTLYAYGMLVAERILEREGLGALHALCLEATAEGHALVPADRLLGAAGLDRDPRTWRHALLADLDEPALREQLRYVAVPLARWLVDTFRARHPELDADGFLDTALPTLGWSGSQTRVALRTVPELTRRLQALWAEKGPAQLRPGEGWWLRDESGVHLTTFLGPSRGAAHYTLSRLALPESAVAGATPDLSDGEVEAHLTLERRGERLTLRSALPEGFAEFRVELDGFLVADLAEPRGLQSSLDERGWVQVEVVLEAPFELLDAVLFHPAANLVVSQRAAGLPAWQVQHFPLLIPRRE